MRAVFRESGNEWCIPTAVDKFSWPTDPLKEKNYRLIVNMVKINLVEESRGYKSKVKDYGDLEDGINVHMPFK